MAKKTIFAGILALSLVFGMAVTGCESDDGDSGVSSGGDGVGKVILQNTFGYDLTDVKLTKDGKQVGYNARIKNNQSASFSNIPHGLCTVSFDALKANPKPSHSFTVSEGETVNINFTQFGNFVIKRSGGENNVATTGSVKIVNTYKTGTGNENKIVSVSIGGKRMDDYVNQITPIINRNSSKTYPNIKTGTCSVSVIRLVAQGNMLVNRGHFIEDVIVKAGETTTVEISNANYGN
jgi:hypothetical protein